MIIKVTTYVEIGGNPSDTRDLASDLSKVACDFLSKNDSKIINLTNWKKFEKAYPEVPEITFISHKKVLEHLRTSR